MYYSNNEHKVSDFKLATRFFVLVLTVLVFGAAPVWAEKYNRNYSAWDNSWSGGQDSNYEGNAYADSAHESYGGKLQVMANANSTGEAWAKAWVQRDFYYDSEHTYWNYIEIVYDIAGLMERVPNGSSKFLTKMELWDITPGTNDLLKYKYSSVYKNDTLNVEKSNLSSCIHHVLEKDRKYRVKFIAYAGCEESSGMGSAGIDFYDDINGYAVTVQELNVWHEHNWTGTLGGEQTSYDATETHLIRQNKFAEADQITFDTYTGDSTADKLEGWYYKIYSCDESSSSRVNTTTAHGNAWITSSPTIPYDHDLKVTIKHWFDTSPTDSCGNCISKKNVKWYDAGKAGGTKTEEKALPDHGWAILYPLPVEGEPDRYAHMFIIRNDDPTELLDIRTLSFVATMDEYEDPSDVEFPEDSIYNVSLTAGGDWSVSIVTDGPMFDGYIYFCYNIYDTVNMTDLCNSWGSHRIAAPLEADTYEVPASTGGLVNLSLDAGKDNAGRMFAVLLGMSGCTPGTTLPGGLHMDLNMDILTQMMLGVGYPFGMLDGNAQASVLLPFGPMALPMDLPLYMVFISPYQSPMGWYASNCISVIIRA